MSGLHGPGRQSQPMPMRRQNSSPETGAPMTVMESARRGLPQRPASAAAAGGGNLKLYVEEEGQSRFPVLARSAAGPAGNLVAEMRAELRRSIASDLVLELRAEIQRSVASMSKDLQAQFRQDLLNESAKTREGFDQVAQAIIAQSRQHFVELDTSIRSSLEECTVHVDCAALLEAINGRQRSDSPLSLEARVLSRLDALDEMSSSMEALRRSDERLHERLAALSTQCLQLALPPSRGAEPSERARANDEALALQVEAEHAEPAPAGAAVLDGRRRPEAQAEPEVTVAELSGIPHAEMERTQSASASPWEAAGGSGARAATPRSDTQPCDRLGS